MFPEFRQPTNRFWTHVIVICILIVAPFVPSFADDAPSCMFCRGAMQGQAVLNIAHAGASSLAPQNTLIAGRMALEAGADVWGVDVRRTQDGVLILMHDETLSRTTDVEELFPSRSPWRVADFSLDEIRTLDAGSWFVQEDPFEQIAQGNVSPDVVASYIGKPVPTLREVLELVAATDWLIDIEMKAPIEVEPVIVAAELEVLLRETETKNRALVSSFDFDILREVRRLAPSIAIGALAILPLLDTLDTLQSLGADVYLPSAVAFTKALLGDLEEAGIHVILWTYNTESQLEYAAGLPGVDGIYTDFPQRLAALMKESAP
ncbi:glycerophosphodiester phosphodiesterase [Candidatus Bipolaricaulota bacterium]